ncbi:leucyl aminopeptidase [Gulosibacter sp. ACHW.36C]|uniref:Probable cytosol aminopeptidase n=1 Tax=Gulosibacter sediminis TaxID=1729695 RepID=A0ABY4N3D3_9MICO|nr:leucyl aminopeptidase [Gulosibacter sediminis]UQN16028.1 leucyl aminopeptidase [Gulosibacter sediminis]
MTSAEIRIDLEPYSSDVVTVIPVRKGDVPEPLTSADLGLDADRLEQLGVTGATGQSTRILVATDEEDGEAAALLIGIGTSRDEEALRRAAGAAARTLGKAAGVVYDLVEPTDAELEALLTGHVLGGYRYDRFKSTSEEVTDSQQVNATGATESIERRVTSITDAVVLTRDLVNTPPSALVPEDFADAVVDVFDDDSVSVEVWDEQRLIDEGCGGVLGVGAGSVNAPRIVHLEYEPENAVAHVALVGKGITFDSGGLSIKPAASMVGMKFDMGGAASVVGTIRAAASLGLPVHVSGWCMLAENMPSGSAIKPDDVLTTHSGVTVEVTNTDAEGRLVLSDGLSLASEQQPDLIVDIATLTGAQVVALGDRTTGLLGNEEDWRDRALAASKTVGEPLWAMPIPEEFDEKLESNIADIVNSKPGDRSGGMLFAGAFLQRFIGIDDEGNDIPWLHFDIAGPAETKAPYGYVAKGATGVPVRTLVELLSTLN